MLGIIIIFSIPVILLGGGAFLTTRSRKYQKILGIIAIVLGIFTVVLYKRIFQGIP
ncbi:MAG: hypothetical protein P4L74_03755 [Candidatus Doudnabacteria bacterium]|nr:hypothetical protein [Candidatus Doudnabacteria bacterium]